MDLAKTKLSLYTSLAVLWTILLAVIGGVGWISFIAYTSNANAEDIKTLKLEGKERTIQIDHLKETISTIDKNVEIVKTILEQQERKRGSR